MTTKRLNLFLLGCIAACVAAFACITAFGAELPAPHFTPVPKFLPVPNFEAKPEGVDDIGLRDGMRIMRACRAATASIPVPQTRGEVDAYVDRCTPIVTQIIKRELRDTFPPSAATKGPAIDEGTVSPVGLYFLHLPGCDGCDVMKRTGVIDRLWKFYTIESVDASTELGRKLCDYFKVDGVPAIVFYYAGRPKARLCGERTFDAVDKWIQFTINRPYILKAKQGGYTMGSCNMAIGCHGSQWVESEVEIAEPWTQDGVPPEFWK